MDRNEAKTILELVRSGCPDDREDPLIAEALEQLDQDAELRAWFEAEQAVDARIAESFAQIEPPVDLKAHILAGMRAQALAENRRPHEDTTSAAWWRTPWLAVAAVFALLFALAVLPRNEPAEQGIVTFEPATPPPQQAGIPGMIDFLAAHLEALPNVAFEKKSEHPESLKAYLASVGTPSPSHLPAAMESKSSIGCFSLNYNNAKMGTICFNNGQPVHLTTVMKTDCMGEFPSEPMIYETRGQAFKVWTVGHEVYILSVEGSKENLPDWM